MAILLRSGLLMLLLPLAAPRELGYTAFSSATSCRKAGSRWRRQQVISSSSASPDQQADYQGIWIDIDTPFDQQDQVQPLMGPYTQSGSPAYVLDVLRAGPAELPVLVVHILKDRRSFAIIDKCPPTGHTLYHGAIDPEILSIEDAALGTRFDLRTGSVRGPWCPGLGGMASAFPVEPLKVLPTRKADDGTLQLHVPLSE